MKESGEGITLDDTGKEDGVVVKEVLQDMTIKIDNVKDRELTETKEPSVKRRTSKDKREKADGGKSKNKSHKDIKDINERLKAQASYGEDVELDYDDIHEDGKEKQGSDSDSDSSVSTYILNYL